MPVKIPTTLPARTTLERENIFVMDEDRAIHQDIRALRVAILNLMPTKIVTETQLLRLLSNSALQVEVTLLRTATYESKNTDADVICSITTPTISRTIRSDSASSFSVTACGASKPPLTSGRMLTQTIEPTRFFFLMRRDLTQPIPDLPLPDGLELRPVTPDHYRTVFDAEVEAFRARPSGQFVLRLYREERLRDADRPRSAAAP